MKEIIQKKDFESYEIILPFSAIAGKRRKQYLCSELEKMHPCFSDEFAFDSAVKKISRKGLCAEVVVMNKYRLAEYEDKRRFSGKGFWLELNSERKALSLKRRFFVDKKWQLGFSFAALTLMACLLLAVSGFLSGIAAGKISSDIRALENTAAEEISYPVINERTEAPPEYNFLDTVAKEHGKISWFEWNIEGFTQRLNASVSGVFPEGFETGTANSVVYENGIPQMKLSFSKVLKKEAEEKSQLPLLNNNDFIKNLRQALQTGGAVLLEENAPPCHIEFLYKPKSEGDNLFEKLAQIISADERSVTSLAVRQTEASQLRIGLSVDTVPFNGFDLTLLSENLGLFLKADKTSPAENAEVPAEKKYVLQPASYQQKLGEIRLKDNSLVIFYKNPGGKIEKKVLRKGEEKKL